MHKFNKNQYNLYLRYLYDKGVLPSLEFTIFPCSEVGAKGLFFSLIPVSAVWNSRSSLLDEYWFGNKFLVKWVMEALEH